MSLLTNLIQYYKLDEVSGTRDDSHSNSYDLTQIGTVGQVSGVINNAADFTGTSGNRLERGHEPEYDLSATDFSFSFFVNIHTLSSFREMVYMGDGGFSAAQMVFDVQYAQGSNHIRFRKSNGSNLPEVNDDIGGSIPANEYIFICCRWNTTAEVMEIRLNGQPFVTNSVGTDIHTTGAEEFSLGETIASGNSIDGSIDEFGFWNRLLTNQEVDSLYNSGNGLTYPFSVGAPLDTNLRGNFKRGLLGGFQ